MEDARKCIMLLRYLKYKSTIHHKWKARKGYYFFQAEYSMDPRFFKICTEYQYKRLPILNLPQVTWWQGGYNLVFDCSIGISHLTTYKESQNYYILSPHTYWYRRSISHVGLIPTLFWLCATSYSFLLVKDWQRAKIHRIPCYVKCIKYIKSFRKVFTDVINNSWEISHIDMLKPIMLCIVSHFYWRSVLYFKYICCRWANPIQELTSSRLANEVPR